MTTTSTKHTAARTVTKSTTLTEPVSTVAGEDAAGGAKPKKASVPVGETNPSGTVRLGSGALAAMVLDHLRANPKDEFTGSQIGKALGRSSGAVTNALVTMVERGQAVQTSEAPRRFKLAPAEARKAARAARAAKSGTGEGSGTATA